MRRWAFAVCVLLAPSAGWAASKCNSLDGVVAEDASRLAPETSAPAPSDAEADPGRLAGQTVRVDLSRDLTSLAGLTGRYTTGVPILGVRLENRPGFKSSTGCNALIPYLYKPRIEALADGTLRASVEDHRFEIVYDPKGDAWAWRQDKDASGRFFWIAPGRFAFDGRRYSALTTAYDARYQKLPLASAERRWVAEAYILSVLRIYRRNALNAGFPLRPLPTGLDLQNALAARLGYGCDDRPEELVCAANRLIEMNETSPPNPELAEDAFRISDAIYANSGVSTGIRQLDFGTANEQAQGLVRKLLPRTVGDNPLYRRPIRKWSVNTMNVWYSRDGITANQELSRPEAKELLVRSHADYVIEAADAWSRRVAKAYPDWPVGERNAFALLAIDLQNVTGQVLARPAGAASACEALTWRDPASTEATSGNLALVLSQKRRMRNGATVVRTWTAQPADLSCLDGPLAAK